MYGGAENEKKKMKKKKRVRVRVSRLGLGLGLGLVGGFGLPILIELVAFFGDTPVVRVLPFFNKKNRLPGVDFPSFGGLDEQLPCRQVQVPGGGGGAFSGIPSKSHSKSTCCGFIWNNS